MWPGVQTAAIKLGRSKGLPLNTHTILYTALFISLSPYPLSPKPSTRAIAWPLIFSRCWVPPFLPFSTLFLTGRLKNKGCAAILPLLSLPALPLPQLFQHISSQTWEAGAPSEQKCFSRTCWCCCCNQLFRQWCIFVTAAVCDMCAFFFYCFHLILTTFFFERSDADSICPLFLLLLLCPWWEPAGRIELRVGGGGVGLTTRM